MKKNLFVRFAVDEDDVEALRAILEFLVESETAADALGDIKYHLENYGLPVVHGANMKVVDHKMDGKKGYVQPGRL